MCRFSTNPHPPLPSSYVSVFPCYISSLYLFKGKYSSESPIMVVEKIPIFKMFGRVSGRISPLFSLPPPLYTLLKSILSLHFPTKLKLGLLKIMLSDIVSTLVN